MIDLSESCLMMIEPKGARTLPLDDKWTDAARAAWQEAEAAPGGWRGWHTGGCGASSDNRDYLTRGLKTNSLLIHYVRDHRPDVPMEEWEKLRPWLKEGGG